MKSFILLVMLSQDFPFEVNVMPVPKDIANNQTVEIGIPLKKLLPEF